MERVDGVELEAAREFEKEVKKCAAAVDHVVRIHRNWSVSRRAPKYLLRRLDRTESSPLVDLLRFAH